MRAFQKAWPALVLAAFAILLLWQICRYQQISDDAFISFRYARNLAAGHGPVFNPGERVEGYTNPLLVLIAAGFFRLGVSPLVGVVWLTILASVALLGLVYWSARLIAGPGVSPVLLLVAPLLVAASRNLAYWSTSGLETVPLAVLLAAAVGVYLRERERPGRRWSGVLFALCYLLRPDAALFGLAATAHALAWPVGVAKPGLRGRLRAAAGVWAPVLVTVALHLAWRQWYYGEWLPNTFYAKTGGGLRHVLSGLGYVAGYAGTYGGLLLNLAPPAYLLAAKPGPRAALPLLCIGLYLPFPILVGGDYFPHYRLLAPLLPLLAVVWAEALRRLWATVGRRLPAGARVGVAAALAAGMLGLALRLVTVADPHPLVPMTGMLPWRAAAHNLRALVGGRPYWMAREEQIMPTVAGRYLSRRFTPDTVLAIYSVGQVPYFAGLPTIDMYGLADRHIARARPARWRGAIAHERHDGAYVVGRRPDVILPEPLWICRSDKPADLEERMRLLARGQDGTREMLHAPGFWNRYRYVLLDTHSPCGYLEAFLGPRARAQARPDIALEWRP